ncbi:MAG: zf-HC2 domain-containing protein [Planctomycetes bacterium]|nr:zf-HC2 domain-containing protein [Planctomycetota bacterium]
MNCRKAQKRLPAMAAGELSERQAQPIREHLKECPACAAELRAYEESLSALQRSKARELPEGAWDGYWERIRDGAVIPQLERPPVTHIAFRRVVGFAAAAAVLVVGLVGWGLIRKQNQAPKQEPAPLHIAKRPAPEEGEQPLRIVGPIETLFASEEGPAHIYMLNDAARQAKTSGWVIQPLPDFGRGGRANRHYVLKQVNLADKDESKYEF